MKKINIERLDDFGNGIGYSNEKIIFVDGCLPGEIVNCEIIEEHKNYNVAKLINIEKKSKKRIVPKCTYHNICGGCNLQCLKYEDTINYKYNKINQLFKRNELYDKEIKVIKNRNEYNYRNKIELKIKDNKIGFYQNKTHDLVEIDKCLITRECINNVIKYLNIKNGNVTIRCNYNDELLLIVDTNEKFIYEDIIKNNKVIGIVLNGKTIYGENYFVEMINDLYFKVSYNSFFQINEYICSKLFEIIKNNIDDGAIVLDLFCGVGTLSIVESLKAKKVYGIEIVENAILDAIKNSKINKRDNLYFMCGDATKLISKIKDKVDIVVVDPPRSGLTKKIVDTILNNKIKKMIYVSCNPQTLIRDLKLLNDNYEIKEVITLDMFSYTYHVETVCILQRKK